VSGDRRGSAGPEGPRGGRVVVAEAPAGRSRIALVERAYRQSTRVLGGALFVLGVAMVVATLVRGGGPLALGVVVGVAFALLGAGRVVLASRPDVPRGRP
jgi:hypothetical protein